MVEENGDAKTKWSGSVSPSTHIAKLTIPRLGSMLSRPRLLKQCDELLEQHKILWIAAPAGSGKSTLIADYLTSRKRKHLWYQVDATDQNIASFFNNLAIAVERGSRLKRKLTRFTPEYSLGLSAFSRNFFRELYARLKSPACIVFDNYQEAGADSILDNILVHALDELSSDIKVIVISRSEPPVTLARFEANNEIASLDAERLNLTPEEERAIVKLTLGARQMTPGDLETLHLATHGWVAGLLLALREIRARAIGEESEVIEALSQAPSEDPARVFGYFATEILARLDQPTREFLYAAALFPGMTVTLCERLTENSKARAILQRLLKDHFFTTRRGLIAPIYEFHPLFRQFLLSQGESLIEQQHWYELKRRSGQLLAEAGESEQSATLLIAAHDWSTLAHLVKQQGVELEKQGRHALLKQWVEALPDAVRESDPWLLYWWGVAQIAGNLNDSYELFERAYRLFREQGDSSGLYQSWLGASFTLFMRLDDMRPAHYWVEQLEWLREQHTQWPSLEVQGRVTLAAINTLMLAKPESPELHEWLGRAEKIYRFVPNTSLRCFVAAQLGVYYTGYGRIHQQAVLARDLQPYVEMPKLPAFARLLANYLLLTYAWQSGNRAESEHAITRGQSLHNESGFSLTAQTFYISVVIVRLSYDNYDGAKKFIDHLRPDSSHQQRGMMAMCDFMDGWLCLRREEYDAARTFLASARDMFSSLANTHLMQVPLGGLVQALIELGDYQQAENELVAMRQASKQLGNTWFSDYYCNYLHAYLLDKSGGDQMEMQRALERSFQSAAREGWVVQSCWDHRMMARLCSLALQHDIEPDYARRLIRLYQLQPPVDGELMEQWPWPVRIYSLDRFLVQVDGQPLPPEAKAQKKPLELLKFIIARGGREVSYSRALDALWPGAEGDAASRNFNITLHRLRQLIGTDAIIFADQRLTLNSHRVWVDLWQVERDLNLLESMMVHSNTNGLAGRMNRLLVQHRRPFLEGEEAEWVLSRRERLHHKLLRVIESVCEVLAERGEHALVISSCERGLEIEPLAERFYRLQMKSLLALGEFAAVATTFKRCHENLQRGLGVAPSTATETIYRQVIQPQDISSFSPQ